MAFFNAYFDESGKDNSRILTLAGYIATKEQWDEFAREWSAVLKDEGVKIFHMKDFENGYGEFKEEDGWTRERKIAVQKKLIGIINRRTNIGIFSSVDLPDYEECMRGWRREYYGTPYTFLVKNCLSQVSLWAMHFRRREPIAYVIEHGAGYNHEINEAFRAAFANDIKREMMRLGSLTFETKQRAIQLQAADMLAYEAWKDVCNSGLAPDKRRKRRKSFELMLTKAMSWTFYDKTELERMHKREDEGDFSVELPEGGAVLFTKPEINAVTVTAESSELERLLDELAGFMEFSPHLVYPLIDSAASFSKAVSIDTDNVSATGAWDFRVLFKPTDFLLSRIAALRTSEGQGSVSE